MGLCAQRNSACESVLRSVGYWHALRAATRYRRGPGLKGGVELKVLQVPFHYYPDAVGGTEVYVASLSRGLTALGLGVEIAAPAQEAHEYLHDGILVHRFGVTKEPSDVAMLYGNGDPLATTQFAHILDRSRPDIVHLHAMSPAVSLSVLDAIKRRGIPTVFTCHIPGITCPRGTLLQHGTAVCDGRWALQKCTACTLNGRGLHRSMAALVGAIPAVVGDALARQGLQGSVVTALRMRGLQAQRQRALMQFFAGVDHVIAVSGWLRDVLVANGVPEDRITVCRHGSTQNMRANGPVRLARDMDVCRVAFLGRLNPDKGVHLLVEALRRRPRLGLHLDIFGIVQSDAAYVEALRRQISSDSRIRLLPALPNEDVIEALGSYDAVVVPSQWLETGPLVVYDAFAAGIPVIGSRRGGLLELVTHETDGLLVEPGDPDAWAEAFGRLAMEPGLRDRLRAGVRPPRSMSAVASEMFVLYSQFARSVSSGPSDVTADQTQQIILPSEVSASSEYNGQTANTSGTLSPAEVLAI
jgi:glycosyltransferase involved in cell wall biosynthesis